MGAELSGLVARLPRPVAFVLGGGGSRGAVQLGMLQAMAPTGLTPDLVVGTSVGSFNGALIAQAPATALLELESVWSHIDRDNVFPGGVIRQTIAATAANRSFVFDSAPLADLLRAHLSARTFEELAVPFVAIATDLDSGQRVELESGDLVSALLASSAVPVAYPWVEREGRRLVDGGLVANVALRQAYDRGARTIVVFDCGIFAARGRWSEGIVGVLAQSLAIAGRQQLATDIRVAEDAVVVYLPVLESFPTTIFDFEGTQDLADLGRTMTATFLDALLSTTPDGEELPAGLYGAPPSTSIGDEVAPLLRLRDRPAESG
jgi:NTE family protein